MAGKGIGVGTCPIHGKYYLDAEDSPCPSCEDGCSVSGHTKEYEVEVLHTRVWKTTETVHAESPEDAQAMFDTRFQDSGPHGSVVTCTTEACDVEEVTP